MQVGVDETAVEARGVWEQERPRRGDQLAGGGHELRVLGLHLTGPVDVGLLGERVAPRAGRRPRA